MWLARRRSGSASAASCRSGPLLAGSARRGVLLGRGGVACVPTSSRLRALTASTATSQQVQQEQQQNGSSGLIEAAAAAALASAAAEDWDAEMEELLKLVALLPPSVRTLVEDHPQMPHLVEVVMDLGRPPLARFPTGDVRLGDGVVTAEDLELAVAQVGEFGGDNRAGIDRTLHRISCIRNRSGRIIGLTCRVGRAIKGSARLVSDLVTSGASILFLGRPGVGKTTAIREVSRALADELQKRVVIVDTSNEIGGDGDIPHEGIGRARRIQVPQPEAQHRVMIEAVENHMPEVVVIDEIGTEAECAAARTIAQRGVQLVATAHGNELENVVKNPALADLVGGIQSVTLGDEEARKRGVQKSILERAGPPTFDVAVEMLERSKWRVHLDVAAAVDLLLAGGAPGGQVRERAADGSVLRYNQDPAISGTLNRPAKVLGGGAGGGVMPGSGPAGGVRSARAAAAAALAAQEAAASQASGNLPRGPPGARAGAGPLQPPPQQQQQRGYAGLKAPPASGVSRGGMAALGAGGERVRASGSPALSSIGSLSSVGSLDEGDGASAASETEEAASGGEQPSGDEAWAAAPARVAGGDAATSGSLWPDVSAAAPGAGGSFLKRSVLAEAEAQGDAEEASLGDDGVPVQEGARRFAGMQAVMGVRPDEVLLRLFPYELDVAKLWDVLTALNLTRKVLIVRRVAQADAVLGLRTRVKTDTAVRQAAKAARVPIYAIKATGTANLVRALRTLLGVDPAAGGVFVRRDSPGASPPGEEGGASSSEAGGPPGDVQLNDAAGQPALTSAALRAEADIATVRQARLQQQAACSSAAAQQGGGGSGWPGDALGAQRDEGAAAASSSGLGPAVGARAGPLARALEEARVACEQLVVPLNQAVELLPPRDPRILEEQRRLVEALGLRAEVLASGAPEDARLRVLPPP